MYLCCLLPLRDILSTVMTRYSLFVLKVPFKPKQTNKQTCNTAEVFSGVGVLRISRNLARDAALSDAAAPRGVSPADSGESQPAASY